jgi:predicted SAM-dependent methyltransferase
MNISELLNERQGIMLDIACGANKQKGFVGIDIQPLEGVDIVWDINVHPWPLPEACVLRAMASHIIEHIPPVAIDGGRTRFPFIEFMNEVWRLMKVGGEFMIAAPHGYSPGFLQDPTHCNAISEATFAYFTPEHQFYNFYRPKPWKITFLSWSPAANIEVVLSKLEEVNA